MTCSRPGVGLALFAALSLAGNLALAPASAQTAAPGALPLDEVMARLAQAPERRAHFTEDKRLAALTTPLRSEGQLAYRKPDHLEKVTTAPRYESLVVDGDRLTVSDGPDATPRVFDVGAHPELGVLIATIRGAVSGDLALLRRFYEISGTGTPAGWSITLQPRDPAVAALVKRVTLVGAADLQAIQSVSPNGDSDTLTITALP